MLACGLQLQNLPTEKMQLIGRLFLSRSSEGNTHEHGWLGLAHDGSR